MRAIGYVRVSTEEQARDGVSLAAQEQKVRGYCALHELELVEVVVDAGASARTLDRPGLKRALDALGERRAHGLVVAKLDRLTRSVRDWAALIERYFGPGDAAGRQLWSVSDSIDTTTAAGRMVLNILMTIAQWEREIIAERTREAHAYKRSRGERLGEVPIGLRVGPDGRTLEPDEAERAVLALVAELAGRGVNPSAIARELEARGFVNARTGRPWARSTMRHILARERRKGQRV